MLWWESDTAPPPHSGFSPVPQGAMVVVVVVEGAPPMRPARPWLHPGLAEFLESLHDPSFDDSETDLIDPWLP